MRPLELRTWLEARGAVYGKHFTFGGLGDDVPGMELMVGRPYTYRAAIQGYDDGEAIYRKTDYEHHKTQDQACDALKAAAIDKAEADGVWTG